VRRSRKTGGCALWDAAQGWGMPLSGLGCVRLGKIGFGYGMLGVILGWVG
jgi:hypothetical protein